MTKSNASLLASYIHSILSEDFISGQAASAELDAMTGEEEWQFSRHVSDDPLARKAAIASGQIDPNTHYYEDPLEGMSVGRVLKKLYAKYADRAFLDTIVTTHWAYEKAMLGILSGEVSSRNKVSCTATLPGAFEAGSFGGSNAKIGVVIDGHITLLVNDMDHVFSGNGLDYKESNPQRTKMSGANKGSLTSVEGLIITLKTQGFVFDRKDWVPARRGKFIYNEAIVDNWKPVAVVIANDPDAYKRLDELKDTCELLDIPLLSLEEATRRF